jgi:hypothetical protein
VWSPGALQDTSQDRLTETPAFSGRDLFSTVTGEAGATVQSAGAVMVKVMSTSTGVVGPLLRSRLATVPIEKVSPIGALAGLVAPILVSWTSASADWSGAIAWPALSEFSSAAANAAMLRIGTRAANAGNRSFKAAPPDGTASIGQIMTRHKLADLS